MNIGMQKVNLYVLISKILLNQSRAIAGFELCLLLFFIVEAVIFLMGSSYTLGFFVPRCLLYIMSMLTNIKYFFFKTEFGLFLHKLAKHCVINRNK